MKPDEFITLVKEIVTNARTLKDKYTDEKNAPVNYACIFAQSVDEFDQTYAAATQLGHIVKETPTGFLFLVDSIPTVAGSLRLVKVRRPDSTHTELGDADFTVKDYVTFKNKVLKKPKFSLMTRPEMEMIELMDSEFNVRAYFSYPPLDEQSEIKKIIAEKVIKE